MTKNDLRNTGRLYAKNPAALKDDLVPLRENILAEPAEKPKVRTVGRGHDKQKETLRLYGKGLSADQIAIRLNPDIERFGKVDEGQLLKRRAEVERVISSCKAEEKHSD